MNDNFKFNTLVKFYYLINKKQKITPLNFKFDDYNIFTLFLEKDYNPVEKIPYKKITNLYEISQKTKDMYSFIILLIEDYYDFCFNKKSSLGAIDFLSNRKNAFGIFYAELMQILLLISKTPSARLYKRISPKIYHMLIKKNDVMTEIYLFYIYALASIKKKSKGENIVFDIFNQEALLREKNEI